MSATLATMADALIEFILSLLHDPDTIEEFDQDPQAALASRGLSNVRAEDVCAVAPVIVERPTVIAQPTPVPVGPSPPPAPPEPVSPVVREIQNITNSFAWYDDRDTLIDQSTNQNIWAGGDVTQVFDQEAVVASGDDAMAAGEDITQSIDTSTNIGNNVSGSVNVGNDTTTVDVDDSFNTTTDASTTNDVDVDVDDSFNENTDTETTENTETTTVSDSGNSAQTTQNSTENTQNTQTTVSDVNVAVAGDDATVVEVAPPPAPAPMPIVEPEPEPAPAFETEESAFEELPSDDDF